MINQPLNIGFAGLSHLGLVYGITMASRGHKLVGYDADSALVAKLGNGELPVFEPDLDSLLKDSKERIVFTSNSSALKNCDMVFVAKDIATDAKNNSDLTELNSILDTVILATPATTPVIVLSQVHPGFMRGRSKSRKNLFYQVETLIFGRAVERALYPERYILGAENPSVPYPSKYQQLLESYDCPLLKMRYESAELAKIAINMYLVSSVSTTNMLAEICENIGADWNEIAPSLRLDKRIGQFAYLSPGLGIAGGNLERDLVTISHLAENHGADHGVVLAWQKNSAYRKDWVLRVLQKMVFNESAEKTGAPIVAPLGAPIIAQWGITYKQDTKSTKNSPALQFANRLRGINIQAYDPQAQLNSAELSKLGPKFLRHDSALAACNGADVLVILTPWKEFSTVNLAQVAKALKGKLVIDPYGVLNASAARDAGINHITMGVGHEHA